MAYGSVTALVVSVCLVAYIAYGVIHIEDNLANSDQIIWDYAVKKYTRALSLVGETLGLGHMVTLYRSISPYFKSDLILNKEGVKIEDHVFDGVNVRTYTSAHVVKNGPGLVWIHGGGWVLGNAASDDFLMVELARKLDIFIVSIDYRLAPEFPYPVPFDDCYRATVHFLANAEAFNVNPGRIAIGGASAGGNLAAAVALKVRDAGLETQLQLQVLVVPCLQATDFMTPSYQENEHNALLPKYFMINFWLWYSKGLESIKSLMNTAYTNDHTSTEFKRSKEASYVNHELVARKYRDESTYTPIAKNHGDEKTWNSLKSTILDPYYAPLMAKDLSNLPEAYVVTAQYDVLRDDGIMYAKRLEKAGVKVTHHNYDGAVHGVLLTFIKKYEVSLKCLDDLVAFLRVRL